MKLYDIYKKKTNNSLIQIDSYATRMNNCKDSIVVFKNIEKHNESEIGSSPSFNGYGTSEEIEEEYELLVPQDELKNYKTWEDIFKLVEMGE